MTFHLERHGERQEPMWEIWSDEPAPRCLCIIPSHFGADTERLARLMLAAVNKPADAEGGWVLLPECPRWLRERWKGEEE